MGNISSSCSTGSEVPGSISVGEVLELVSREEAATGTALALVTDQASPAEEELSMRLSALGVEMGEASVAGRW